MSKERYDWNLTDIDCSQYIKRDGNLFCMIEMVEFDVTGEDRKNGVKPFVVFTDNIDLRDYNEEEKKEYLSPYYEDEEIDKMLANDDIVAECILEEEILTNGEQNAFVLGGYPNDFDTFEEADEYIKRFIRKVK